MEPRRSVALEILLRALPQNTRVVGSTEKTIAALTLDSRAVEPGSLFVAVRGQHTDGHRFVEHAAHSGAAAVVTQERCGVPEGVTEIVVPDSERAASQLADAFYGSPSREMAVAGITGTNGKTTATHMLAAMLEGSGTPAAIVGTVGASFGEHRWNVENTTPLAPELHRLLAEMRSQGARAVAMEVSSHAVALQRVADVHFAAGALTNVTRDHLDFHKTFDAYAAAKRRFFDLVPRAAFNADDELGSRWSRELAAKKPVVTYGFGHDADVRAESVEVRADGSTFTVGGTRFELALPGRFNVSNALCALALSRFLGAEDRQAAHGLAALRSVPGRMQHVGACGIDVVVDYAHTPDALANVLRSLRETARGRLVVVFGCGGDRDRGKRPEMGAAAARYADLTVVTSDNPRSEDPAAIIAEIVRGVGAAPHAVEPDRRAAIERAIAGAQSGDVVLVAGKGHETYQIAGGTVHPFDDAAVVRQALAQRAAVTP